MIKLGQFSRNVLVIFTGTVTAQAITILASPLLTRLYSPEDFGIYALFLSMVALLTSVICARYEFSITLPAEDRHGLALSGLCTLISIGIGATLLPLVALFGSDLARALNEPRLERWLWLMPLTMVGTGFVTAARYWLLRTKRFRELSIIGVVRSAATAVLNIGFGVLGWVQFGLIGGMFAGLFASVLLLGAKIWRESGPEIRALRWSELREQAIAQRRFPQYSLGSAVIESGASQIPVFFLSSLFGAGTLGWFSLAQRIANLPLLLIAQAVGDVFRQRASELYVQHGNCRALFDRTFASLLIPSLPAFAFAAWVSPLAFETIFGAAWRESGEYVRYLVPALALRFVSNPLSSMFYIAQKQATDLVIQSILVVSITTVFFLAGCWGWTARNAVMAYSAVYSVKYLVELFLSRRYAAGEAAA